MQSTSHCVRTFSQASECPTAKPHGFLAPSKHGFDSGAALFQRGTHLFISVLLSLSHQCVVIGMDLNRSSRLTGNCIANAPGNFHNCDIDTRQLYRPLPCFESSCDQSSALDLAGRCIDRLPDRKQSVTHDRAGPWRLAAAPEDLPTRNILSLPLWLTVSSPSIRHRRPSVRPLDPRSLRLARPHRCQLVVVTLIRHHVRSHD